ncbi:MAG: OmpH family outer membrane protein [Schleiferiaceae bacterium]|jgi:outer membrane protein
MMRGFVFTLGILVSLVASAQRMGYVDTQALLKRHPMYVQAQAEMERLNNQYHGEVQSLFEDADALRGQLEAERVLLTSGMISEREKLIANTLDSARTRQMRYFAPEGTLFSKRQELVEPIQSQIAGAIREVARRKKLDFVFDKGSNLAIVYANESLDITNEVLQQLGF